LRYKKKIASGGKRKAIYPATLKSDNLNRHIAETRQLAASTAIELFAY
jgi:hypothetical protein